MKSAHAEVERLCAQIRAKLSNPAAVERLTDQISALCQPYMAPQVEIVLPEVSRSSKPIGRIMALLMAKKGKVITRQQALEAIYFDDPNGGASSRILDVYIFHARNALKKTGLPYWIKTHHGTGFSLEDGAAPENLPTTKRGATVWAGGWSQEPAAVRARRHRAHAEKMMAA